MDLILKRKYSKEGTNGTLFVFQKEIGHTIELPWKENQRSVSCIPEGKYLLRKRYSVRFKWHLELMFVENRSFILIHPANTALKELRGCIAPVTSLTGEGKGIGSRRALQKLKALVFPVFGKGEKVYLTITS
ncbi:DUF5675 family protein [Mesonia sp. MT50]|uniref:DUF5675 family protein n=1 Tax=Mesonia profundi TaxID=3070998 RepID=A0ABU1A2P9_9FLAO|nr:DUF5675 family protein [Mesonia profundi]MDQ7917985.1 DUF5675 family protein [Mesonia profundi]